MLSPEVHIPVTCTYPSPARNRHLITVKFAPWSPELCKLGAATALASRLSHDMPILHWGDGCYRFITVCSSTLIDVQVYLMLIAGCGIAALHSYISWTVFQISAPVNTDWNPFPADPEPFETRFPLVMYFCSHYLAQLNHKIVEQFVVGWDILTVQ